jgi:3-methyladenine DNA glycosylase/8-oxoguanine DNA glycosylase
MPRIRLTDKIAKMTSITERLDKIASELEQVDPQIALVIDQVSDRLEGRNASDIEELGDLFYTNPSPSKDSFSNISRDIVYKNLDIKTAESRANKLISKFKSIVKDKPEFKELFDHAKSYMNILKSIDIALKVHPVPSGHNMTKDHFVAKELTDFANKFKQIIKPL